MQFNLSDYPLVIEPTAEILEVTGGVDALNWTQLHRIPTHVVWVRLFGITSGLTHFFGPSADMDANPIILGYTTGGRLHKILRRDGQEWDAVDIPLEALGNPVIKPSLRLVFETERARASFLFYVSSIRNGKVTNASMAVIVDQLAEPPVVIDVWRQQ